jgi:hypothetical protein
MPGRGRSLSIVFGTWATSISSPARSSMRLAVKAVSSPPMVMRKSTSRFLRAWMTFLSFSSLFVGFSREVPRIEPPVKWMRDTSSMVRCRTLLLSPRASHWKPSRMPMTLRPHLMASMVADRMTPLMPGAGPPPTRMASVSPRFLTTVTR